MKILTLALLFSITVSGCASTVTAEDREYNNQADRINWEVCETAIIRSSRMHVIHDHDGKRHRPGTKVNINMIKDDLILNKCHLRLGNEHWIDHIYQKEED